MPHPFAQNSRPLPSLARLLVAVFFASLPTPLLALDVVVSVVDLDGKTHRGTLTELSNSQLTVSIDDEKQSWPLSEIVSIQCEDRPTFGPPRGAFLMLVNGDRLAVRPNSVDSEKLQAAWERFPSWPKVEIPLETVRFALLHPPTHRAARDDAIRFLNGREDESDLIILKNGDNVAGEFLGMRDNGISLKTAAGEITIPQEAARAISFNPTLLSFPDTATPRSLLTLTDGSRLTIDKLQTVSPQMLICRADFGAELQLPLIEVDAIRFLHENVVYLSDLTPIKYEYVPFLSGEWKLARDTNVTSTNLQIRGREYVKGIGMHSRSMVTYNLDSSYRTFHATIGIDDSAGGKGNAVFVINVDDEEVFRSDVVTGKSEATTVPPIDVSAAKQLTLSVEFGEFGDTADYADWCDAYLVKKK